MQNAYNVRPYKAVSRLRESWKRTVACELFPVVPQPSRLKKLLEKVKNEEMYARSLSSRAPERLLPLGRAMFTLRTATEAPFSFQLWESALQVAAIQTLHA